MTRRSNEHHSDVKHLLAQIDAEYEAAQRGLTGFSSGSSRHAFITARMEQMGHLHTQLHHLVGDAAIALIAERLNERPDPARPSGASSCERDTTERNPYDETRLVE